MNNVWFISDTHFNHTNALNFLNKDGSKLRDFKSIDHMNEMMITNWNRRVHPSDIVWHLGDVFFGAEDKGLKILDRLNGRKNLIVGNHDKLSGGFVKRFSRIELWLKCREEGIVFSHMPLHQSTLAECGCEITNFHGHIHGNRSPNPTGKFQWVNMCVEQTGYKPLNLSELKTLKIKGTV